MPGPRKRSRWFLIQRGTRTGPYRSAEIRTMVQEGVIRPEDQLWKKGMKEWVAAGDSPELFVAAGTRSSKPLVNRLLAASGLGVSSILCSPWSVATESLPLPAKAIATGLAALCFLGSLGVLLHAILLPFPSPRLVPIGEDSNGECELDAAASASLDEDASEASDEDLEHIPTRSGVESHAGRSEWTFRQVMMMGVAIAGLLGVAWLLVRTPSTRKRAEGTVTIAGRSITSGQVMLADETNGRAYLADIDESGSFVFYSRSGSGIQTGHYRLAIMPPRPEAPSMENLRPATPPAVLQEDPTISKYADPASTGIEVDITPVGAVRIDVSLP